MNSLPSRPPFAWRLYLILGLITLGVGVLLWRVFTLAILDQPFLRREGDTRVLRIINVPAFRGMIVDRNQFPLAVSTTVYSAWMNPKEFLGAKENIKILSKLLNESNHTINNLFQHVHKQHREFAYLKRGLSPQIASRIQSLHLPGIYLQKEYRRYYPEGEVTAHVLGFTNVDDKGQEGLELFYNKWLEGEAGKKKVIQDRTGRIIADVTTLSEQKPGNNLTLSIDRRMQYLAYRELIAGVSVNQAESGSVVILDVNTGEILAMVNFPSFNPNNRQTMQSDRYRNRAITDLFEPGSTLKTFSIASVMNDGTVTPDTLIDTSPGWLKVGRNIVRDEHPYGLLTVTKILQKSSNVGVTKLILSQPPNQLWELLHQLGFGEVTGINFPGEQSGSLVKHSPWGAFTLATLAFGYGVSVTALQLAHAYATLANQGIKMPLSLLRVDQAPKGEKIMNSKIAQQMLLLLETVVKNKEGTGKLANVPGYRIAGKTGTSKKAGNHGYLKGHYTSSFVGIAPVSQPRVIVAVIVNEPKGVKYHGGEVSAPIFEHIMEGTLRLLGISPDESKVFAQKTSIDDTKLAHLKIH